MAAAEPIIQTVTTVTTVGTILAFAPFGVTIEQLALGAGLMIFGALARTGFAVQTALEGGGTIRLSKTVGALAAAFLTAPFVSELAFATAHLINFQSDVTVAILLLIAGYSGPASVKSGVDWVLNTVLRRNGVTPQDQGQKP